jgi:hypothetical protein
MTASIVPDASRLDRRTICVTVPLIGAPSPRTMSVPRPTVQVPSTFSNAKPLRLPDTAPSGTAINAAFQSTTFCQNGTRKLCS